MFSMFVFLSYTVAAGKITANNWWLCCNEVPLKKLLLPPFLGNRETLYVEIWRAYLVSTRTYVAKTP